MRRKKLTLGLLVGVIAIWTAVVIRWIGEEPLSDAPVPPSPSERLSAALLSQASSSLLLNYRDPFLGKAKHPARAISTLSVPLVIPPQADKPVPPFVYRGAIRQGESGSLLGLIEADGKLEQVWVGEKLAGWWVKKISLKQMTLQRDGEQYELLAVD